MTYTFTPVAAIQPDHTGFFLIAFGCVFLLLVALINEPESFFALFFVSAIILGITYGVSYHWTNQDVHAFKNEQVTGTFVSYQPEGYREQVGKIRSDRHYMYVVYEIEGQMAIFRANEGVVFPKTGVFYKN